MLHYAAAHEKQPPPCPVCATPLMVKDMKPTKMVQWDPPAEEVHELMFFYFRQIKALMLEISAVFVAASSSSFVL